VEELTMAMKLKLGATEYDLTIHATRPHLVLGVHGRRFTVRELGEDSGARRVEIDGRTVTCRTARSGNTTHLHHAGRTWAVRFVDPRDAARDAVAGSDEICAPMPGMVVSAEKQAGEAVHAGETVLTIESMKLQLSLAAPRAGRVAMILKGVGETFEKDEVVATLQPEPRDA
jgi:acetyl/propionyl-CoA carboxylase alpha subunit